MRVSSLVLKAHGLIFSVLGFILFLGTLVGRLKGVGMFSFLKENPVAAIGFHEAYVLIGFLGFACFLTSNCRNLLPWQCLILIIHLFLIVVNISHWSFYSELNMVEAGYISTCMHVLFSSIEMILIIHDRKYRIFEVKK